MTQTSELITLGYLNGNINKQTWGDILYNVKVYGAKGDGVTNDTLAVQTAINAAIADGGKLVFFPHGSYKVTSLSGLSSVILSGDNAVFVGISTVIPQFGDEFNGGFVNGNTQFNKDVLITDTDAIYENVTLAVRRTTSQTAGNFNNIGNALGISTVVNAGVNHAEFVISSVIDAYNTSSAGQLALIAKGNKHADVPVWGANIIAQDYTGNPSGLQGMFGLEINIDADAADTNNNRKGLYLSGRRNGTAGTAEFYAGLDITAEGNAKFTNGIVLKGLMSKGISMEADTTVGIDFSGRSTTNKTAIRVKGYDTIDFNETGTIQMRYHVGNDFIEFLKNGARIGYINCAGADHAL